MFRRACLAISAVFALNSVLVAETVNNTVGIGGDVVLRRNMSVENDGLLRIKTASGDTETNLLDRIGLIKMDLSSLTEAITDAAVRFELPRGASTGQPQNTFNIGETLFLYGVPETDPNAEDFDESTVSFSTYPYFTGLNSVSDPRDPNDATANGVNDTLVELLDTFTFTITPDAGDIVSFRSSELVSFLQSDTNDIASFILTSSQSVDLGDTAVFVSDTGTEGTPLPPELRTNTDVVNADFNGGGVDITDFHVLRANYLTGTLQSEGDANFDGIVNHEDFFEWRKAVGSSLSATTTLIPEPNTTVLLVLACAVCNTSARRRRTSTRCS